MSRQTIEAIKKSLFARLPGILNSVSIDIPDDDGIGFQELAEALCFAYEDEIANMENELGRFKLVATWGIEDDDVTPHKWVRDDGTRVDYYEPQIDVFYRVKGQ